MGKKKKDKVTTILITVFVLGLLVDIYALIPIVLQKIAPPLCSACKCDYDEESQIEDNY